MDTLRDAQGRFQKTPVTFAKFMLLPSEVRLRVYQWFFGGCLLATTIPQGYPPSDIPLPADLALLTVNQQIHSETKKEYIKHVVVRSSPWLHGPRHHLGRDIHQLTWYPVMGMFATEFIQQNVRHIALAPHSLGMFAFPLGRAQERKLRHFLPKIKSISVWWGERRDVLDDLPWNELCNLRAGSLWQGNSQCFQTSPGPNENVPRLHREAEIHRANVWHVSGIMENNSDKIRSGKLQLFMEYWISPRKVARAQLSDTQNGHVEVEIVWNTSTKPQAITGQQLGVHKEAY